MDPEESRAGFSGAGMSESVRPATQKQQRPEEKDLCRDAGNNVVRVEIKEVESDDSWSSEEETDITTRDTIMPLGEVDPAEGDGFSHSGGPGAEIEERDGQSVGVGTSTGPSPNVEAGGAPDEEKGPRILKAPRAPTQK